MWLFDMTRGTFIETDAEQRSKQAETTLQHPWPTAQPALQTIQSSHPEHYQPNPGVIAAGLEWM